MNFKSYLNNPEFQEYIKGIVNTFAYAIEYGDVTDYEIDRRGDLNITIEIDWVAHHSGVVEDYFTIELSTLIPVFEEAISQDYDPADYAWDLIHDCARDWDSYVQRNYDFDDPNEGIYDVDYSIAW